MKLKSNLERNLETAEIVVFLCLMAFMAFKAYSAAEYISQEVLMESSFVFLK